MSNPRALTVAEMRDMLLSHLRAIVDDCASSPIDRPEIAAMVAREGGEVRYRLSLAVFSILTMIDGENLGVPALDIVARPHPDDRRFHKEEGTNWWEDGAVLNDDGDDVALHEQWNGWGRGVK